jgi:hypothetical protein
MAEQPTTFDEMKLSYKVRLLNQLMALIDKIGLHYKDLSTEQLMVAAMKKTGLSDWGEDVDLVKQELEVRLKSYREDARLTFFGRYIIYETVLRLLANRLLAENDFKTHPEILRQPVTRPLFVTGLPRTGTTLLHRLLGQDPDARVPLLWELMWPTPPPVKAQRDTDPRIQQAADILQQLADTAPLLNSIHGLDPKEPEECVWIMEELFAYMRGNVSSQVKWLLQQDLSPNYRYYRKMLQLLQWHTPGDHWILKSPFHLYKVESILNVFPDACIVQTHRAPETVVASFCSLVASSHKLYSDDVDPLAIGQLTMQIWTRAVKHTMEARARLDPKRFYDVYYEDLMADPVGICRQVYDYFGYDYSPAMETAIKKWLSDNPQNKHGVHRYSLEQFGLNKALVQEQFKEYTEHYQIGARSKMHATKSGQ